MQSLSRLTLFLCCLWAATILYGEMIAYLIPLWSCSWPQPQNATSSSSSSSSQVKIAVIADPQIMDRTSLLLPPGSAALEAVKFYTDLYMRRSFRSSVLPFDPDIVVFLGDHFDGGPVLSDQEWQESLRRFRHIFSLDGSRKSDISAYYLSGNHDIGYANFISSYPKAMEQRTTTRSMHQTVSSPRVEV